MANGATTQCAPAGSSFMPTIGRTLQMKQLRSRGRRELKYW